MQIRIETPSDHRENENLIREAFWDVYNPGCDEHLVMHKLRSSDCFLPTLTFVAEEDGKLIGSIAYAKLMHNGRMSDTMIGFGPLAVLPAYQKTGIGKALIEYSLQKAREMGFCAVLITGDPDYYSRFGFVPASDCDLHLKGVDPTEKAPYFMALELAQGALADANGIIDFAPEYYDVADIAEFDKHFPPKKKWAPSETDLH